GNATLIGVINLAGNIALLMPVGFLLPFIYHKMTWKTALILGVAAGLLIESAQVFFHVGIFDIDDIILNALGTVFGFLAFSIFFKYSPYKCAIS
ncbi:VanZ family protein, partial [archaeon]